MDIGQVVVKLNGRFAGYYGFVKEKIDDKFLIIGIPLNEKIIKNKKTNIKHVIPIPEKKIPENALNDNKKIIESFKSLGIEIGKRIKID